MSKSTWQPPSHQQEVGTLGDQERDDLPETAFAFPKQRKMPLSDANHVRNAVARFNQVEGVSDKDRAQAWLNIKKAAKHWHIQIRETSWREAMASGE